MKNLYLLLLADSTRRLIDNHYYAIANKASLTKPKDLAVTLEAVPTGLRLDFFIRHILLFECELDLHENMCLALGALLDANIIGFLPHGEPLHGENQGQSPKPDCRAARRARVR